MEYPKGTKFNFWSLSIEDQKGKEVPVIRRWVHYPDGKKKLERYPSLKYKSIRDNPKELQNFIIRINQVIPIEQRTKQVVEIRHAFISPTLLDNYKEFLHIQIPNKTKANYEFSILYRYFLVFFINTLQMPNPVDWHIIHKTKWAKFLLDEGPNAADTKKKIVFAANRFMQWLHEQRPQEVPPLKFSPLSKAKFKEIEAKREMAGEVHEPKMISDKDWKIIKPQIPELIVSNAMLAYYYGERRSETLGHMLSDVKKGHLSIERQLESCDEEPVYGPLKGREMRKVPHWFATPTEVFKWVSSVQLMHPDTLSDRWKTFMESIGMDYTFHDLRHTFITKAIRNYNPRDVQLAAGHKNIQTTMGYTHDDRDLSDEQFVPKKSS